MQRRALLRLPDRRGRSVRTSTVPASSRSGTRRRRREAAHDLRGRSERSAPNAMRVVTPVAERRRRRVERERHAEDRRGTSRAVAGSFDFARFAAVRVGVERSPSRPSPPRTRRAGSRAILRFARRRRASRSSRAAVRTSSTALQSLSNTEEVDEGRLGCDRRDAGRDASTACPRRRPIPFLLTSSVVRRRPRCHRPTSFGACAARYDDVVVRVHRDQRIAHACAVGAAQRGRRARVAAGHVDEHVAKAARARRRRRR